MAQKYLVLKPIRYKNEKSKLYRQVIQRGEILEFPHLSGNDLQLLVTIRVLIKASKNDEKRLLDAKSKAQAERQAIEEQKAQSLASQKASAMAKMIEKIGDN